MFAVAGAARDIRAQEGLDVPSSQSAKERVLVLHDGGALSGQIARQGDRFVLTHGGGQMYIAASRVSFVCDSLEQAYAKRRQQLSRPTAAAHLALAEWCLRHRLHAQAAQELADARAIEPHHGKLPLLERRLAWASKQSEREPPRQSATPPQPHSTPIPHPPEPMPTDLPDDVVERFTRKVQPILVNSCTQSGCHQPGGKERFQLNRAWLHGLANRRTTMNNLAQTMSLVDREQPQLSPLLTVPRHTHAGMKAPIFGPRHEQAFQHLVEWVAMLATSPPSHVTPPAAAKDQPPVERADLQLEAETPGVAAPAEYEQFGGVAVQPPQVQIGAQLRKWEPRDPFDPEIFNRRHQRATAAATTAEAAHSPAIR